jgi:hypothetical protein
VAFSETEDQSLASAMKPRQRSTPACDIEINWFIRRGSGLKTVVMNISVASGSLSKRALKREPTVTRMPTALAQRASVVVGKVDDYQVFDGNLL